MTGRDVPLNPSDRQTFQALEEIQSAGGCRPAVRILQSDPAQLVNGFCVNVAPADTRIDGNNSEGREGPTPHPECHLGAHDGGDVRCDKHRGGGDWGIQSLQLWATKRHRKTGAAIRCDAGECLRQHLSIGGDDRDAEPARCIPSAAMRHIEPVVLETV